MNNTWLAPKEPVWLLKNATFTKGIIETLSSDNAICTIEDGSLVQTKKSMLFQRDPSHKHFNQQRWDLMDTDVLNEPEVLQTLKLRLYNNRIYTFVENSLLAVNPYYYIHSLYSNLLKSFYGDKIIQKQENIRDPHLYAITAFALKELSVKGRDQAVVISGQSGSGKTQANKECMRFLQFYFHQEKGSLDESIDGMLSLSTPILEAFGNSKTIRNNNSSRFGKYLDISLSPSLQIKHVQIYNYLLEKSRIISRADNEQNFHVFYQILKGLTAAENQKYFLIDEQGNQYQMQDFNYLKNSKNANYEQHPDISFDKVRNSLNKLKDKDAFDFACRLLSAILQLGNLVPYQSDNEDCCKIENDNILDNICQLLLIKRQILLSALICYPIRIGSQTLTKYFNCRQVQQLIHSLAKTLYERLFQWAIIQINLICPQLSTDKLTHLGFLDIYGFEMLENNSLEQLFINYTNERLHQVYLAKIFKEEQELFKREGLIHKFRSIDFSDNVAVLELIDYEQLSVFNLLDQWCAVASPDDSVFITKLRHKHKKHPCFPSSNFNLPPTTFLIKHSPKDIEYSVIGFRQKNKDLLREQIKTAMRTTALPTLAALFEQTNDPPDSKKANHKMRKFLSFKFRHEMNSLMEQLLGKCDLHFIRCIKSNGSKQPLLMEDEVVYNQICYLGILDTIRLKKIGYCMKLEYETVDRRFKWLVRRYFSQPAFIKQITQALRQFLPRFEVEEMLFGKNMVFFKDYVYSALTRKYDQYLADLNSKCSRLQQCWRLFKLRRKIANRRKSSSCIISYLKGALANRRHRNTMRGLVLIQRALKSKLQQLRKTRREKNLITLQCYMKKEICRLRRLQVSQSVQKIVNFLRRLVVRRRIQKYAVVNLTKEFILQRCWMKVVLDRKYKIQKYLLTFLTQIGSRQQIITAHINTNNKFRQSSLRTIHKYLRAHQQALVFSRLSATIRRLQCICRSWIYRNKYCKLRDATIVIQRAYRQYYFNKNTARQIFDMNFGQYHHELQIQNVSIRKFLYDNPLNDSLKILYASYLAKFRQKCCLFYMIVDFEAFINLQHSYPENSWLLNYFQVVKDGFERDSPLQGVEVTETFTVATTTNRVYVWGMNSEVDTLQKMVAVKQHPQTRVERVTVTQQQIALHYQGFAFKQQRTYSTINRTFNINNGKLQQIRQNNVKLIKMPLPNQRIIEVACGSNHVILRTANKKIYTFGNGRLGQLGHGTYNSIDQPKLVEFAQFRNYPPLQITATFNSSIVLLSNKKIYWFGTNGTIDKVKTPTNFEIVKKFEEISRFDMAPLRVRASWSRSASLLGITFILFTGKLATSIGLRNKIHQLMLSKWQEQGIDLINPPFNSAYSDYLEECHVKLPRSKISIEPESRKLLKKMQEKVNSLNSDKYNDFSFSDPNFK